MSWHFKPNRTGLDLPAYHYYARFLSQRFVVSFFVGNDFLLRHFSYRQNQMLRDFRYLGVSVSASSLWRWKTGRFVRCGPLLLFYFCGFWGCEVCDLVAVGDAVKRGESPDVSSFSLPDIEELRAKADLMVQEESMKAKI